MRILVILALLWGIQLLINLTGLRLSFGKAFLDAQANKCCLKIYLIFLVSMLGLIILEVYVLPLAFFCCVLSQFLKSYSRTLEDLYVAGTSYLIVFIPQLVFVWQMVKNLLQNEERRFTLSYFLTIFCILLLLTTAWAILIPITAIALYGV
ncbi:hypothetical protein HMPREF2626_04540 [Aerococcus sp. HMSC062A02]|nr:hypothetical protein F6I01_06255 [Aerococcus sanguinicola]OFN04172.1 hypothetical protein HMPREF2626_04540 [Aerococcus sp. HMSC062A02]OHO45846.1 hypothetical protein HMPREF2705_03820 [Aerococcus sp. HMSC035B07]